MGNVHKDLANKDMAPIVLLAGSHTFTTGQTGVMPDGLDSFIIKAAGTLAALTFKTPAKPYDNQPCTWSTNQTITAFSPVASSGSTLSPAQGAFTFNKGESITYRYNANDTIWYRQDAQLPSVVLPSNIALTGSPQTYQNTSGIRQAIIISGATPSDISLSRDNATYYTTGQIAGQFILNPNDYLKLTYAGTPIMTAMPL